VKKLRWETPERPLPKHPYRDSAIAYGGMAAVLFAVVVATGGSAVRGAVAAVAVFVAATAYSWWRWRQRIRERRRRTP
jgi:membrane protein implicated in regulation of membrane protease activity